MQVIPWVVQGVKIGNKYNFTKKAVWKHNLLNLFCLFLIITSIILLYKVGGLVSNELVKWFVYLPLASFFFGWLYFSLIILVSHEASHGLFLLSQSMQIRKKLNMFFGSVIELMFNSDFRYSWYEDHNLHHRHPLVQEDPQNCPLIVHNGKALARKIAKIWLIPGYAAKDYNICRTEEKAHHNLHPIRGRIVFIVFLFFWITIGVISYLLGNIIPFIAMLIGLNFLQTINRLKITLEHGGGLVEMKDMQLRTRTTIFPGLWLVFPFHISYHFEHHLNCVVPWYELPHYHKELYPTLSSKIQAHCYNMGFKAAWKQLEGKRPLLSESYYLPNESM
jgi:fatty acid desaturase